MKRLLSSSMFALLTIFASSAIASVASVPGGYEVTYDINLGIGSSNGGDIRDTFIFEWNESNEFNVDYAFKISAKGTTRISHVIDFEPTSALLMGYALGIPGVGDEKDHIFTVNSQKFLNQATGLKWSQAFPGVPPDPRIGHNAMINLLKEAAGGSSSALDALQKFVETEGYKAGFDPAGSFRVMEWSVGVPVDKAEAVPTMSAYGLALVCLGVFFLATRRLGIKI